MVWSAGCLWGGWILGAEIGGAVWYRKSLIFDFLSWKPDIAGWKIMKHLQMESFK